MGTIESRRPVGWWGEVQNKHQTTHSFRFAPHSNSRMRPFTYRFAPVFPFQSQCLSAEHHHEHIDPFTRGRGHRLVRYSTRHVPTRERTTTRPREWRAPTRARVGAPSPSPSPAGTSRASPSLSPSLSPYLSLSSHCPSLSLPVRGTFPWAPSPRNPS